MFNLIVSMLHLSIYRSSRECAKLIKYLSTFTKLYKKMTQILDNRLFHEKYVHNNNCTYTLFDMVLTLYVHID